MMFCRVTMRAFSCTLALLVTLIPFTWGYVTLTFEDHKGSKVAHDFSLDLPSFVSTADQAFLRFMGSPASDSFARLLQVDPHRYVWLVGNFRRTLHGGGLWVLCDRAYPTPSVPGGSTHVRARTGQSAEEALQAAGVGAEHPDHTHLLPEVRMCIRMGQRRYDYLESFNNLITPGQAGIESIILHVAHAVRQRLHPYPPDSPVPPPTIIVVDVGANQGLTVGTVMDLLVPASGGLCEGGRPGHHRCPYHIFAFEPMSSTYAALLDTISRNPRWARDAAVEPIRMAVAAASGPIQMFAGFASDDASRDPDASRNIVDKDETDSLRQEIVESTSLDDFFAARGVYGAGGGPGRGEIWLVKVDVEGYDADVLLGAETLLRAGDIKFIVFEYGWKWFTLGRTFGLESAVRWLEARGYVCFMLHPQYLVPLSGPFWSAELETRYWSNCLCGRRGDKDLRRLVLGYDEEGPDAADWVVKELQL